MKLNMLRAMSASDLLSGGMRRAVRRSEGRGRRRNLSKHRRAARQMQRTRLCVHACVPAYVRACHALSIREGKRERERATVRRGRAGERGSVDAFRGTKFRDFDEREAIRGTALCAAVVRISTPRNENRNKNRTRLEGGGAVEINSGCAFAREVFFLSK